MSPEQSYAVTESALSTLTLEEINAAAAELCAHITGLKDGEACTPKSAAGPDAAIDDDRLCEAVRAACVADVVPVEDVVVPQAGGARRREATGVQVGGAGGANQKKLRKNEELIMIVWLNQRGIRQVLFSSLLC